MQSLGREAETHHRGDSYPDSLIFHPWREAGPHS